MNDDATYCVLVNSEDQYSLWPAHREIPAGWRAEGTRGSKDHCTAHVDRVWTDMRPRSLREQMDAV
ncbi:MbtH family protein [Actinokineospora enzanensis]|uniref:MbtH family protein n=1 Tax=Actinokineospora enzanensis TaxID=155975 RepID=UPI0003812409|nr:MbtH family NRPS accessory protein [Actinokineospora enzanensis]